MAKNEGSLLGFRINNIGNTNTALSHSITWATANNTAAAGSDYTAASGTVAFAAGETFKDVFVQTLTDGVYEGGNETFFVNLSANGSTNGATISDSQAVGTIADIDDTLPSVPTLSVSSGTGSSYTVSWTASTGAISYCTTVTLDAASETGAAVNLFTQTFAQNAGFSVGTITLTVNHPYPASADGSVSTGHGYMDAVVAKRARYTTPLTIVHGWGDTGREMVEKWGTRLDGLLPNVITLGCEICNVEFHAGKGDGRREQLAVSWLAQSSRAARLHASIAKAIYTHHHSLGVVAGDSEFKAINITSEGTPTYRYTIVENFDRLDIDSAFSLTSKTADAVARRGAIHAIAETSEALEGSVAAQIADLPDTTSTATRFEWGNRPPLAEDQGPAPGAGSPRRFYEFVAATAPVNCLNGSPPPITCDLIKTERQLTTTDDGVHTGSQVEIGSLETRSRRIYVTDAISDYALAGFNVVVSEEAFVGPGQRGGAFDMQGQQTVYMHRKSKQRGGAFVATRYVGGEPVEIAHIAVGEDADSKGGGGGPQTGHQAQYDPSTAADILKSRFVDRSKALGVDLLNGGVSASSSAALSVGNGGFPYELSANLIWTGGNRRSTALGPVSHTEPQTPWSTNWNNTLTVSGSSLEMMGDGDVRATAATIVAFLAAQTGNRTIFERSNCGGGQPSYVLTRGWNYAGMTYKVKGAQGDEQTFQYWESTFQASDSSYCADLHGFRLTTWTFPQGVTINLAYSTPAQGEVPELLEVSNSLGRKITFVGSGRGGFTNGLSGGDARSVIVSGDPLVAGTITHTDPGGAVTKYATPTLVRSISSIRSTMLTAPRRPQFSTTTTL